MIITISGKPGSGKSTLAKLLAEKIGYKHYYIGGLRREMARARGLTLHELNTLGEQERWTDSEVDEYQKKLGENQDNFIIEGRTSFMFIPQALKIFIDVNPRVGAERVLRDIQKSDERNEDTGLRTVEDVLESHRQRTASDMIRYEKYYHINVYDTSLYDFVLDTSDLSVADALDQLSAFVSQKIGVPRNA